MTLQQHRLLKEAGQLIAFSERLKHAQKETTDRNWKEREEQRRRSAKAASTVTALSGDIEEFLTSRYDFRYNLLTDEPSSAPPDNALPPSPPWQARVEHFLHRSPCRRYSLLGQGLEPIRLFHLHPCLPSLPALHGRTARLGRQGPADCACLPRLFSASLVRGFHTWMLGLASQWMGVSGLHANSVLPFSSAASRDDGNPAFVAP